jgi:hypothetical protein
MSATIPQTGRGTTLSYSPTSGGTLTLLALVTKVEPSVTIGKVETTVLSSTFKPQIPTLAEGDATFTIKYASSDPGAILLRGMLTPPTPIGSWVITFQDLGTCTFPGFITGFKVTGVENESVVEAEVPITITGQPVWA